MNTAKRKQVQSNYLNKKYMFRFWLTIETYMHSIKAYYYFKLCICLHIFFLFLFFYWIIYFNTIQQQYVDFTFKFYLFYFLFTENNNVT